MTIGNQTITKEDMPSYTSPSQQPFHLYQSMQDTLSQALQRNTGMMMQPNNPGNMSDQGNQWSQGK